MNNNTFYEVKEYAYRIPGDLSKALEFVASAKENTMLFHTFVQKANVGKRLAYWDKPVRVYQPYPLWVNQNYYEQGKHNDLMPNGEPHRRKWFSTTNADYTAGNMPIWVSTCFFLAGDSNDYIMFNMISLYIVNFEKCECKLQKVYIRYNC